MTPPLRATLYAFSGGRAVLGATVAHALAIGTLYGVFIALNAAPLSAIGGREQSLEILSSRIGVSALAAGAFYFLLAASYEAALLRWLIRRETEGFGSLSLGAETWRVFAGHVLWLLIAGAVSLPLLLAPASSSTTLQISGEGAFGEVSAQASLLVVGLGAGWAVAMVISSLRLAPGNAASIARRRFAYFDALRVSAGRSSALLGSFALVGLISAVGAATLFLGGSLIIYSATLFAVDHQRLFNLLMFFDLFASIIAGHLLFIFLSAGVNARAALAAIDSGKLAGVLPETVKTFD